MDLMIQYAVGLAAGTISLWCIVAAQPVRDLLAVFDRAPGRHGRR